MSKENEILEGSFETLDEAQAKDMEDALAQP